MSEDNREKSALVPRLRFPDFDGIVSALPLAAVADFMSAKTSVDQITPAQYVSTENLLPDFGGMNPAAKLPSVSSVTSFRPNDVLVSNIRPYLRKVWQADIHGGASNDVLVVRATEPVGANYLAAILRSDLFIDYVMRGAKGVKMPRGEISMIQEFPVPCPCADEQQKIADCLSSLDELIAAETQKLDALKAHKKGLMQQLFPREGETVPRLRFPEFREAGEWREKPIGETLDLLSGFPFDGQDIREDVSGVPLMRGINITEGFVRHNQDIDRFFCGTTAELDKYRLRENDLVIGMDGSKVGKNSALVTDADAGALLVQRVARLRAGNETTIHFVFQHINSSFFHAYVDRINTSGGIPHISLKQISDFKICFPGTSEQQQIADCLSSLDDLITTQSQKIAALKTHKQGLMQQLFPVLDEVQA